MLSEPVALFLTGCEFEDMVNSDRYKQDFQLKYPVKSGGKLTVETFNGGVEVISWEKEEVEINGVKSCGSEEALSRIQVNGQQNGNDLSVVARRPEGRGNCGVRMVIRAPKKMGIDGIRTSNASVRVENMVGDARLTTSNGSIKVRSLEGKLEARTSNAGVDLAQVIGDVMVRTSNGSITVEGVEGAFDAETSNASLKGSIAKLAAGRALRARSSNGGIDLALPEYAGQAMDVETSNATITLRLPSGANAEVRATTSHGDVSSEFGGERAKDRWEGKLGNGGSVIRLETSNGNVRLQKL